MLRELAQKMWRRLRIDTLPRRLEFQTWAAGHRVVFIGRGTMFVNPHDNRARLLLDSSGVSQPGVTKAWRSAVRDLTPDLVLDVGANYGEIVLSTTYPKAAAIYVLEPNQMLFQYLTRSSRTHRNAAQFQISNTIASDRCGKAVFYVDEKWSGTSSTLGPSPDAPYKGPGDQTYRVEHVTATTLDALLQPLFASARPPRSAAIKIDVEGVESEVLKGAAFSLRALDRVALLVEFNQEIAGVSATAQSLFELLASVGQVFVIDPDGNLRAAASISDVGTAKADVLITKNYTPTRVTDGRTIAHEGSRRTRGARFAPRTEGRSPARSSLWRHAIRRWLPRASGAAERREAGV
jgi:FkbM family methyltransferase